jgi:thiol-disulfide isomerase/thioredoxin
MSTKNAPTKGKGNKGRAGSAPKGKAAGGKAGAGPKGTAKGAPTSGHRARSKAAREVARRRRRRDRILYGGLGVVLVAVIALVANATGEEGNTDPAAWDLPAMGPTAEVQERVTLASMAGKPTIANFFASWCTACDDELPGFRRVSEELRDDINFVGIASQETGDEMLMPRRHGVDWWPLARDIGPGSGAGLSRALGARGMPLTAFYDESGELLTVQLGAMTEPQLRAAIAQLYGIQT